METDNKIQNKVLVIFSTICKEVSYLEKEAVRKYLPNLLYYGESCSFQNSDEQLNLMANELLVQLLDVLSFVRRCRYVLVHFLQQLANTFSIPQKYGSDTYFPIKFQVTKFKKWCHKSFCQLIIGVKRQSIILITKDGNDKEKCIGNM
ncbi:hypothetical protein AAG570_012934 [Ranatra chinensis]|uniref:WASH complex subunit 4 N-terminal domain-containing protein n=1 Tax=Ranatra chinensis TaxID=642074 RepID=A0ABD0YFA5_9HEMI